MYITTHIDAIISLAAGVYGSYLGFRKGALPAKAAKGAKVLRILGPGLAVISVILLFAPAAPANWQRASTDDGFASAEFPGRPERKESLDTSGAGAIKRSTVALTVRGQDITLHLSSSPVNNTNMTDDQRIDALVAGFRQQGLELDDRHPVQCGDAPGISLSLHNPKTGASILFRLAVSHNVVYRALATFKSASEKQEEIRRFIETFEVRNPPAKRQP